MDNQRIRNITTPHIHTSLADLKEDMQRILQSPQIHDFQVDAIRTALAPVLQLMLPSDRYWDYTLDLTHTGEFELPPLTDGQRNAFMANYHSLAPPIPPSMVNSFEDDVRLYLAGRYNEFHYSTLGTSMMSICLNHRKLEFIPAKGDPELHNAQVRRTRVAIFTSIFSLYDQALQAEGHQIGSADLMHLISMAFGYIDLPTGMGTPEQQMTGFSQEENVVFVLMVETIRKQPLKPHVLPDPLMAEFLSYIVPPPPQPTDADLAKMFEQAMGDSGLEGVVVLDAQGNIKEVHSNDGTEHINVADPSDTAVLVSEGSTATH